MNYSESLCYWRPSIYNRPELLATLFPVIHCLRIYIFLQKFNGVLLLNQSELRTDRLYDNNKKRITFAIYEILSRMRLLWWIWIQDKWVYVCEDIHTHILSYVVYMTLSSERVMCCFSVEFRWLNEGDTFLASLKSVSFIIWLVRNFHYSSINDCKYKVGYAQRRKIIPCFRLKIKKKWKTLVLLVDYFYLVY